MVEEYDYISRRDVLTQNVDVAPVIDYGLDADQVKLIDQSPRIKDIVRGAASVRSERGGRQIDQDDILLALLDGSELGGILSRTGHYPSAIRLQLSEVLGGSEQIADRGNRNYTLTPNAQRIVRTAIEEASARGHVGEGAAEKGYAGAGGIHVLSAITRGEAFAEASDRFSRVGVNPEQVRELAVRDLDGLRPMPKTDPATPFD